MPNRSSWVNLLGIALVVATLLNGAATYLKRTGVVDRDAYRIYWAVHCHYLDMAGRRPAEWQCDKFTSPAEIEKHGLPDSVEVIDTSFDYVYDVKPGERPLKLVKDLFLLTLIATAMGMLLKGRIHPPAFREGAPLFLLAAYSTLVFLVGAPMQGPILAAMGLRSFMFIAVALLCHWLVPHIGLLTRAVAVLLLAEAALIPFEMIRGIHHFHEWTPVSLASRAVGTLVQPNSMGVFAVTAMAFYYCFSPSRRMAGLFALVTLGLVLASGSGTGLICAALAALVVLIRRFRSFKASMAGLIAAGAVVAVLLPVASGRGDVFDSVTVGRMAVLRGALLERPIEQVVFGSGLGVNTNLALTLGASTASTPTAIAPAPTDSALIGLFIQIGLVGTGLFYATLAWAARRDMQARPFYAVVGLCTLTMNVTELFPVNFLLGLVLAHSFSRDPKTAVTSVAHGR